MSYHHGGPRGRGGYYKEKYGRKRQDENYSSGDGYGSGTGDYGRQHEEEFDECRRGRSDEKVDEYDEKDMEPACQTSLSPQGRMNGTNFDNFMCSINMKPYGYLKDLTKRLIYFSDISTSAASRDMNIRVFFNKIQADPYAPGSQLILYASVPRLYHIIAKKYHTDSNGKDAGVPSQKVNYLLYDSIDASSCVNYDNGENGQTYHNYRARKTALEDYLLRSFVRHLHSAYSSSDHKGDEREALAGGANLPMPVRVLHPSQHVLERTALRIVLPDNKQGAGADVELRLTMDMPGFGRKIDSKGIMHNVNILTQVAYHAFNIQDNCDRQMGIVNDNKRSSSMGSFQQGAQEDFLTFTELISIADDIEDQEWLREKLEESYNKNSHPQAKSLSFAAKQKRLDLILEHNDFVAFVVNGAVIPRLSGTDDRALIPLDSYDIRSRFGASSSSSQLSRDSTCVVFKSPPSLQLSFLLPQQQVIITGMALGYHNKLDRQGNVLPQPASAPAYNNITVLTGGGFHGKSTLLRALSMGIYNKVQNDGREYVISVRQTINIRSEDRRSVTGVDISPFINHLPHINGSESDERTRFFFTKDASGSTSQAANIIEALEMLGARDGEMRQPAPTPAPSPSLPSKLFFLIDEDTSATNFMIRDELIKKLIKKEKEPITAYIEKAQALYQQYRVSSLIIIGGSGHYLQIADVVLMMDSYVCRDATANARSLIPHLDFSTQRQQNVATLKTTSTERSVALCMPFHPYFIKPRNIDIGSSFCILNTPRAKCSGMGKDAVKMGDGAPGRGKAGPGGYDVDLSRVEQLAEPGQTNGIAAALCLINKRFKNQRSNMTVAECAVAAVKALEEGGGFPNGCGVGALPPSLLGAAKKPIDLDLGGVPPGYHAAPGLITIPRPFEVLAALNRMRHLTLRK